MMIRRTVLRALPGGYLLAAGLLLGAALANGCADDDSPSPAGPGGQGGADAGGADAGSPDGAGGATDGPTPDAPLADGGALDLGSVGGGMCNVELVAPPSEGANHTDRFCLPVSYASNPPASGTHYGSWPVFRAYDKPVPWGFLVHALEHGAVVIAYNCPAPAGCAAEIAAAKALMASVPPRPACPRPPVILTPDPGLPVKFAASAWGHVLRASCFDRPAFAAFITAHANQGPEFFDNDCGVLDLEAEGWCPAAPTP